ncbi:MAG: LmbE family protein, partial [Bacteroidota bacterium]
EELVDGINTNWNRYEGGENVQKHLEAAIRNFTPSAPHRVLPDLIRAHHALSALQKKAPESTYQVKRLEETILACAGFWADATIPVSEVAQGDSLEISVRAIRRTPASLHIQSTNYQLVSEDSIRQLEENKFTEWEKKVFIPTDFPSSQPYWLTQDGTKGMFRVDTQKMIGLPENPPALQVTLPIVIEAEGEKLTLNFKTPVEYREVRPDEGERYRPLAVVPPLTVNLSSKMFLFSDNKVQEVRLTVKSFLENNKGTVRLDVPKGWTVEPKSIQVELEGRGSEKEVAFQLTPPAAGSEGELKAIIESKGVSYTRSFQRIDYRHIPVQTLFPKATAKVVKVELEKRDDEKIGYIMGAGDEIPDALRQIGYEVTLLDPNTVSAEELAQFTTVILGVRAYNTEPRLRFLQEKLIKFVESGGNMIVQYNTSFRLVTEDLGPYPLKLSRDRVTVEEAPMTVLTPEHPVLNFPNKITEADFEGWKQERGLYFPNEWDENYTPIFSCHDPNEDPKEGSLLVTEYGKGTYIYTGLSFFRELPPGVAGAYRLFVNLISYRQDKK